MFNDFDNAEHDGKGRGRMGLSLALSAVLFGVLGLLLATVVATARAVVREREVPVEFASLPPVPAPAPEVAPPPPPPPPEPRPRPQRTERQAAQREAMGTPREIPDVRPSESDGDLVESGPTGPIDGFTDGGGRAEEPPARPTPPAPAPPTPRPEPRQERLEIRRPQFLSGCRAPMVPEAVQRQAATIPIVVQLLIGSDGHVQSARVTEGHPLIPEEVVLACARDQRFEPARLTDGTAVPYPFRRRFVFRPSNL